MTTNTKARNAALHAVALLLVGEFGITRLDAMPNLARAAQLAVFRHQLMAATGCTRDTARQHIAKAVRRLRSPVDAPPPHQWGGVRPGAGRPRN